MTAPDDAAAAAAQATAPVAVLVVTRDAADDLPGCLAAVAALDPAPAELLVVDCASADASVEVARRHFPARLAGDVVALPENLGFAGGTNAALARSAAPWALTLNADARPEPDYLARLLARAAAHP
ncbi:MAG TPA: glycosyltransferase, partial [Thermoanaerobaculia bacterium]|nr:glycosyltransferase [Thermoanaerobaculia bacterium]